MKYLIISDLHLGHHSSSAPRKFEALSKLARTFDQVVVNGDALDKYDSPTLDEATRKQWTEAQNVLEAKNGPPVFLTGNHDPLISKQHYLYLPEPRLLIFHGDFVLDCSAPWEPKEWEMDRRFRSVREKNQEESQAKMEFSARARLFRETQIAFYREFPLESVSMGALEYVLRHAFPPSKIFRVLHYNWYHPGRTAALATQFDKPVKHVVCGHSHRAGRWTRGEMQVYNTGSFMPYSKPMALRVDGEAVLFGNLDDLL